MKLLKYIALGLALSHVVSAQDEPEPVSFDFRCLAMSKEMRLLELYVGVPEGTDRLQVRLNDLSKTASYRYTGAPQLYFYDQPQGGVVVASYRYSPRQESPLLIFVENANAASPAYSVLSIEDSWSKVGAGSSLLVNLSSKSLYWQFGDERFQIPSRDQRLVRAKEGDKTPVIALEVDTNGNPFRVYRGQWLNVKNMRRLIFVRDTTEREVGSVRVKVIEDFYIPLDVSGNDSAR